ncbi:hypothetical protein F0562_034370 [Nyssa sinensis]|uniref:Uncharacterized protein n=1 Tax=Nyssa sinensis TaxID=561372 RepID=A0A5J5AL01_9ASTE|nr:hypothetical protein F0562_034370 [Nyssa sinensis]
MGVVIADKVAVIELLFPSVFRAIVSLHPAGSIDPDAVAFFSPDEGGSYVHARGFSVYHVFRHITEHATIALQYFLGNRTETALYLLLHWICSYQTLFTKVCSKCGRLLSMDRQAWTSARLIMLTVFLRKHSHINQCRHTNQYSPHGIKKYGSAAPGSYLSCRHGWLGKTTLARKIYTDPSIEYPFYIRAWTYVSQEYNRRELFLNILSSLTELTDQMFKMSDERLGEELCINLKSGKHLIVIDDVWTTMAWDDLKMAFPNTNNGSGILLTSRHTVVALHANHNSPPHHLRFLTDDESWELLHIKVFHRADCPSELEELGKQIAKKCSGLPLAVVVVAGLLSKKYKTHDWWKKVAESASSYVASDPKQCMDILALRYKHLPHHLRVCFIYFGLFPEEFDIPVWKLLRLWVAEGFIQQIGQVCLEDIAEEYLEDLVDRNLILVAKRRTNGRIKACRIHDLLRDLCLREAAEEKFLQEITWWDNFPPNLKKLTLSETFLNWEHTSTLGKLPHLEVLKLKDNAFLGQLWEPLNEGFRLLKVLQLGKTDLVHWKASGHHFPSLQRIVLRHCTSLKAIPSGLGDIYTLQMIELYCPTSSAAASARLIQLKRQQLGMVENWLKLVIYPPDL